MLHSFKNLVLKFFLLQKQKKQEESSASPFKDSEIKYWSGKRKKPIELSCYLQWDFSESGWRCSPNVLTDERWSISHQRLIDSRWWNDLRGGNQGQVLVFASHSPVELVPFLPHLIPPPPHSAISSSDITCLQSEQRGTSKIVGSRFLFLKKKEEELEWWEKEKHGVFTNHATGVAVTATAFFLCFFHLPVSFSLSPSLRTGGACWTL